MEKLYRFLVDVQLFAHTKQRRASFSTCCGQAHVRLTSQMGAVDTYSLSIDYSIIHTMPTGPFKG